MGVQEKPAAIPQHENRMIQRHLVAVSLAVVCSLAGITAHEYYTGKCPNFTPMKGFDWNKFSDNLWYVTEKFDTKSTCLTYRFKLDNFGFKSVEQVRQLPIKDVIGVDHDYIYTGKLFVPDESNPAKMIVRFPLNPAGAASYVVTDTDYNSYAMVCTCQDVNIVITNVHRVSCSILQKDPKEDEAITDKLKNTVPEKYLHDFDKINHDGCEYEREKAWQIDVDKILAKATGSGSDEEFNSEDYPSLSDDEVNAVFSEFSRNVESSGIQGKPGSDQL